MQLAEIDRPIAQLIREAICEDEMPRSRLTKPAQAAPDRQTEITAALQDAKRRGYRLPGEPSQWENVTPQEIIRRLHKAETDPSDVVSIPPGSSVEEIVALMLGKSNA